LAELQETHWIDCQPDFATSHFLDGFPTSDGKFHFSPDWSRIGPDHERMPDLPDHFNIIEAADERHPFRLVAAPAHNYLNSSFTETPTSQKKEERPRALLHPDDAARLGTGEGRRLRMGNDRGEVVVHAKLFDGLQPGVVVVESIWPNGAFEGGVGLNTLIAAEAGPPNGGAVIHDTSVWLRTA
jgi:anaerobic selenocysteine-containing dehydrogenase